VPLSVIEFMERERRISELNPTEAMFTDYNKIWEVQKRVAVFLGTSGEKIFLRNNVTAAFSDFLFSLPPIHRGEVLCSGWEYGGIVGLARHWAKLQSLDFRVAPLELNVNWAESALADAVISSLSESTKVLVVSHVGTGTGAILPVKKIAEAARERGVITLIDGAHAIGAIPLSIDALDAADFYGGNFHKWFLGPEGTGFGWVHPRWSGKLNWKFGGWASEAPPAFYQSFGDGNAETCQRFFPGTIDRVPFLALSECLSFWEKHGADRIRNRQTEMRDLAAREAEALGWERISPSQPSLLGPLVSFRRPEEWGTGESIALATRLYREAKVQLALPNVQDQALVRFSPGVYAREREIKQAFLAMAAFRA